MVTKVTALPFVPRNWKLKSIKDASMWHKGNNNFSLTASFGFKYLPWYIPNHNFSHGLLSGSSWSFVVLTVPCVVVGHVSKQLDRYTNTWRRDCRVRACYLQNSISISFLKVGILGKIATGKIYFYKLLRSNTNWRKRINCKKWANPGLFFIYLRLFKQTLQFL